MQLTTSELGRRLIDALGLPKETSKVSLVFEAGEVVRVVAEFYPDEQELASMGRVLTNRGGEQ